MMYQYDPPLPPKEVLPTMYDLKSEDPEEPGLPDTFHIMQPRLLDDTFRLSTYPHDQVFTATDLYLYYDVRHPLWHKRPDWFAAVGVSRLYEQKDLRWSYVTWQEGVNPFIVIELLSPGTEKEDLGQTVRDVEQPPTKWEVYERILRIPYYVVFDRYQYEMKVFKMNGGHYHEIALSEPRLWIPELEIGLGVWEGRYQDAEQPWLRWYDETGNWMLTPTEQERQRAEQERQRAEQERQRAEQEKQRAEQERQRTERLIAQLRSLGVNPDVD